MAKKCPRTRRCSTNRRRMPRSGERRGSLVRVGRDGTRRHKTEMERRSGSSSSGREQGEAMTAVGGKEERAKARQG